MVVAVPVGVVDLVEVVGSGLVVVLELVLVLVLVVDTRVLYNFKSELLCCLRTC